MAPRSPAEAANSPRTTARGARSARTPRFQGELAEFRRPRVVQEVAVLRGQSLEFFLTLSGKLEKGGRDSNAETFPATQRVNESRPAEPSQQPEARLAWGEATPTAKRRQRVP